MNDPSPRPRGPAPNVYLVALELRDVRCFQGQHRLRFTDRSGAPARWTLLLGENGVGKTTLLEVVELARPVPWKTPGGVTRVRPAVLEGLQLDSFARRDAEGKWSFDLSLIALDGLGEPASKAASGLLHSKGDVSSNGRSTSTSFAVAPTYGYSAARRHAPLETSLAATDADGALLLHGEGGLASPEDWLIRAELMANKVSAHRAAAERQLILVKDVLRRVLPEVEGVRVGIDETRGRVSANVEVSGPDGWVPYASLSLGYRTMTAWMVDLAIRLFNRYPHLPDPLKGAAICLVDEIDLHLHPRWQRSLMGTLSDIFPNVQFIATAHSPLMVQAAEDANVVVLRRERGRVIIDNEPPNVEKWRVDQILTSPLFGLPSARAPELDAALRERDELLGKDELTAEDDARLAVLSEVIGAVPYGETPEDIDASNTIRRAAKKLAKSP